MASLQTQLIDLDLPLVDCLANHKNKSRATKLANYRKQLVPPLPGKAANPTPRIDTASGTPKSVDSNWIDTLQSNQT